MTVFCNTLSLEDILGLKNWEILLLFFWFESDRKCKSRVGYWLQLQY